MAVDANLFSIELDDSTQTFVPGSNISGKVNISTTSKLKTSRITLHACGRARVIFSMVPDEVYFSFDTILWHEINHELSPGHHEFPFSFILPSTSPRSFNAGFGSIKYSITAKIHGLRWFNKQKRETISFHVTPKMNPASTLSKSKTIIDKQRSCFSNKSLRVLVTINKRVFARDEVANLSINVSNDRSSRVKCIETSILTVARIAQTSLISGYGFSEISCHSHFSREKVNVPELCRSHHMRDIPLIECLPTIQNSSLFQVCHFIRVKAKSTGWFDRSLVLTSQIVLDDNFIHEIQLPAYMNDFSETFSESQTSLTPITNGSIYELEKAQAIDEAH